MSPTTIFPKVSTAVDLELFIKAAKPGEACIYHIGYLVKDRDYQFNSGSSMSTLVDQIGSTAWVMEEEGAVYLFQRRLDNDVYEYLAVRSEKLAAIAEMPIEALAA